ncbi:hypothetical protein [Paracoccus aminophilus]|uniref:Uncharacterized protein n=1 Tax=Paracoccus aminophilus JCM 7686 TaxID=1367847 RepID=S5XP88_PARAH|nr:hypothetical protein [Paracoccus aminophilus]AGT09139.1 hypothetical protein JCM7686_2058 [Paracoccus aminophilus JCM 7686]
MSHTAQTTAEQRAEAKAENQLAARILIGVALLVVALAGAIAIWGLPALTMFGLFATATILLLLVAYAAGF